MAQQNNAEEIRKAAEAREVEEREAREREERKAEQERKRDEKVTYIVDKDKDGKEVRMPVSEYADWQREQETK